MKSLKILLPDGLVLMRSSDQKEISRLVKVMEQICTVTGLKQDKSIRTEDLKGFHLQRQIQGMVYTIIIISFTQLRPLWVTHPLLICSSWKRSKLCLKVSHFSHSHESFFLEHSWPPTKVLEKFEQ